MTCPHLTDVQENREVAHRARKEGGMDHQSWPWTEEHTCPSILMAELISCHCDETFNDNAEDTVCTACRLIGTPWVSCRFADVHAKTRKSRAEVGQNIITVDSALFKFTVAKISNSDFYSK